ncbi:MAG: TerC family protein [Saprospiraceae bacterium]|nr:TerC family protein [Saprospiraceae bacterium]
MTEFLIPLLTLIALELILGIDNIIFISILADKLPKDQSNKLRYWGLGLAVLIRLILLGFISWILKWDKTLFSILDVDITGKGLILILGGLFLIWKSTKEIYLKTEDPRNQEVRAKKGASFNSLLMDIVLLDLVFSVDSIITAVGMVSELWIMYTAVIVSVILMLIASKPISDFIQKHPSFKILALSFLMLIGMALIGEGLHFVIPKGYIYFSMFFSFIVNLIQIKTNSFSTHEK